MAKADKQQDEKITTSIYLTKQMCDEIDKKADREHILRNEQIRKYNEGMRHGLFGKLSPGELIEFETWQEVAREVRELSYKKVNIFRSVISFAPETAVELGLDDHKAWEQHIERHIQTLAQKNGISIKNLSWVCAHHNKRSHPHIHVAFGDKNQRVIKNFIHPKIPDGIRIQLINVFRFGTRCTSS